MLKININYIRRSKTKKPLKNIKQGSSKERGREGKERERVLAKNIVKICFIANIQRHLRFCPNKCRLFVVLVCFCMAMGGEGGDKIRRKTRGAKQEEKHDRNKWASRARVVYSIKKSGKEENKKQVSSI